MDSIISELENTIPATLDWLNVSKQTLIIAGAILLLALIFRWVTGKLSDLNQALSTSIGIILLYIITVVVYVCVQEVPELPPLPFAALQDEYLLLFHFQNAELNEICYQLLSMVVLAFFANLFSTWIPKGTHILTWYLSRILSLALAMAAFWCINYVLNSFLPADFMTYTPVVLLGVLIVMLFLGLLKLLLGVALTIANPIIGALYTFFFSNVVGKQVSKALFTTVILCAVIYLIGFFGFTVITITASALLTYIPLALILLALWYVLGHVL